MSENIDTTKEVELNEKIGVVGNELSDALESQSGADEFQLPSMISTMSAHFKDSKRLTERVVLTWDNINYSTLVKGNK